MPSTNLGAVAMLPRGTYSAAETYHKLNVVEYQGSAYIALGTVKGIVPTNTAYWMLLVSKGASGDGSGDMLKSEYGGSGVGIVAKADDTDKLQGQPPSYYRNASNLDAGAVPIDRLPTGTSSTTVSLGNHAHSEYLKQETDPTVPAWAKAETKPTYTAAETGALPRTGGAGSPMNGPIVSNATTMLRGSYGGNNDVLFQQDTGAYYVLLTDAPGGPFNGKRPLTINKATGRVSMSEGLGVSALTMTTAAAYTAFRRSASMGEDLWTGSLAVGGAITIANIADYKVFGIIFNHSGGAVAPAVFNQSGTGITGGGFMGYDAAGLHRSFYCTLLVSGTTVTYSIGSRMDHLASGAHSGISTDLTITRIVGIA